MGEDPLVEFEANSHKYNYGYFLADVIYPKWFTFVKSVVNPEGKKQVDFHNAQAVAMKDVRGPDRFLDQGVLWYTMNASVIMDNMIIEDECC
jgi:hypothetical protein